MPDLNGNRPPGSLTRLHAIASGLLAAMAVLFIACTLLQATHPWLGYVRAFSEAAMVGALADWFAVVALFRRPLGLPIPHTAVIQNNKDRIGESLGRFVETHFLPPDVIRSRLEEVDFTGQLSRWLADPGHAAALANQVARLLLPLVADLDPIRGRRFVREKMTRGLDSLDIATLGGDLLNALTADGRHQRVLDGALHQIGRLIVEKEPYIREKIRASTGWLWKRLAVDERAFNGIMNALESLLREVEENPEHELRQRLDKAVADFAERLRTDPDYREQATGLREKLLASPALQGRLEGLWDDLAGWLAADAAAEKPELPRHLQAALIDLGKALATRPDAGKSLNAWLRETIAEIIASRRQDLARLIPDTVRTWDGETMARRLEAQVGRDLQFIRINGTLVGGLVGLAIYAVSNLLGA